jgi:amino acid transporter
LQHEIFRDNAIKPPLLMTMMSSSGGMSGVLFLMAVILVAFLLMGLIVGSLCLFHAYTARNSATVPTYFTSQTTWWVYGSIAFAIGVVMLLVLLYLGYAWSCACKAAMPSCPPKKVRNSCAPSACY